LGGDEAIRVNADSHDSYNIAAQIAAIVKQGGYDWGFLAYAVGFGGSMIWFGSSAGVAISNMYPDARSVGKWLRHGWYVAVAYVIGFFAMLAVWNWHPDAPHSLKVEATAPVITKSEIER